LIQTLEFNVFDLAKETHGNELFMVINYILTIENMF